MLIIESDDNLWGPRCFLYTDTMMIAGLDEVGRGALAGPIVAGAVIFRPETRISGVRDSKQLTARGRERLFVLITKEALAWSVGVVSNKDIDRIGIQVANHRAFVLALDALSIRPEHIMTDWFPVSWNNVSCEAIVGGDQKVFSISAASILAKVWRDTHMQELEKEFPRYGFAQHKGYGTKLHYERLTALGPSPVHRTTFLHTPAVLE